MTRPTACLPVRISRAALTGLVELLQRDRLLVGGDLEDGVRRRVDDPLPRPLVLLAELLDDLGPRGRLVAEDAATGLVHEGVDHVVREAVRIGGHRGRRDDAHQLPVAGRRVLALRPLEQAAGDRGSSRLRRAALERHDVAEAERLQRGQVETSDGAGDVAERVRPLIAVRGRVGQLSRANGIEHDYARPRHAAILRRDGHRPRVDRPHLLHRLHRRARGRRHVGSSSSSARPRARSSWKPARTPRRTPPARPRRRRARLRAACTRARAPRRPPRT